MTLHLCSPNTGLAPSHRLPKAEQNHVTVGNFTLALECA